MREWLTVIIILLFLGVLLDGIRRVRAYRRQSLRLSRRAAKADEDGLAGDPSNSEFPSGGARVAAYRDPNETVNINQNVRESYAASRITRGAPNRIPEQVSLNLESSALGLSENAASNAQTEEGASASGSETDHSDRQAASHNWQADQPDSRQAYTEDREDDPREDRVPSLGSLDDLDEEDTDHMEAEESAAPAQSSHYQPSFDAPHTRGEAPTSTSNWNEEHEDTPPHTEAASDPVTADPLDADQSSDVAGVSPRTETPAQQNQPQELRKQEHKNQAPRQSDHEQEDAEAEHRGMPDEVLIINVMAKRGERFAGPGLLESMLAQGLRFGDMDIFHRHETADGRGKILFSVANIVVPGTFDLEQMDEFDTPGISMFLSLPIESDSLEAFNLMAHSALAIAEDLGGELKDENRSVMTRQTIEHGRQRVIEYERKRRLAKS